MSQSERVKALRLSLGLSQREMARRFQVRHGAVSQWESGKRKITGPAVVLLELMEQEWQNGKQERRQTLDKIQSSSILRTVGATKVASALAAQSVVANLTSLMAHFESTQQIERKIRKAVETSLLEKLGEFKGLHMKLGQMISYLPFLAGEETRELLADLQDSSTPLAANVIAEAVQRELGEPPEKLFAAWDPIPLSAASIGQVHRARLPGGSDVVVKVQYPGIKKVLKADLSNASLAELFINIVYRKQARGTLMKEMRERFLQECDYRQEAKNQERFRQAFASAAHVKIPKVFAEYCSERVLTSEFCEGVGFAEFVEEGSQEKRNGAGATLYRFAYESIFQHHIFNCDPHPGNYLFDGDEVVFLDFGCTKEFSAKFVDIWRAQQKALLDGKEKRVDEISMEMGLVVDPDKFDFEYHRKILTLVAKPIFERGTFRFDNDYIEKTWRLLVIENPNRFCMNLPADWLFTNRLQWGLFSVLAALRVDIPCRDIYLECCG